MRVVLFGRTPCQGDWEIRPRVLREHLFYFLVAGRYVGVAGRRRVAMSPGSLLWLPPGMPHRFGLDRGADCPTLYHLRLRVSVGGEPIAPMRGPLVLARADPLAGPFAELFEEYEAAWPDAVLRFRARLFLLLSRLARLRD